MSKGRISRARHRFRGAVKKYLATGGSKSSKRSLRKWHTTYRNERYASLYRHGFIR